MIRLQPGAAEARGPLWGGLKPNVTYFAGKVEFCVNCGADPLGGALRAAGRPRPAPSSKNQAPAIIKEPARGPAADEGVRPTK